MSTITDEGVRTLVPSVRSRSRDFSVAASQESKMRMYHNPFHLRLDKAIYFVTAKTYNNQSIFNQPEKRSIISKIL